MHLGQRTAVCLLSVFLPLLTLGCASTQGAGAGGAVPHGREACFNPTRVRSYAPLADNMFVYLEVGGGEHYLLTLVGDVNQQVEGRPVAGKITITGGTLGSNIPRVCKEDWPQVAYIEAGEPVFRRAIRIEAVASKEEAERLVRDRTSPNRSD